jgi:hypothetical protein
MIINRAMITITRKLLTTTSFNSSSINNNIFRNYCDDYGCIKIEDIMITLSMYMTIIFSCAFIGSY